MTVKYYTDEATGRPKIVTKDGKVSCSCCGYCKYFDIDVLLYEAGFSGGNYAEPVSAMPKLTLDFSFIDFADAYDDSDKPSGNWGRKNACWRFLCREVSVSDGQITSETNKEIGGPTTNNKDLWEDICKPLFGDETESGTFIYSIGFQGWHQPFSKPTAFIPSDTGYEVEKWQIIKIP